jgi:hypothetical protein
MCFFGETSVIFTPEIQHLLITFFWHTILLHLPGFIDLTKLFFRYLLLKMKVLDSFETSWFDCPVSQRLAQNSGVISCCFAMTLESRRFSKWLVNYVNRYIKTFCFQHSDQEK